MNQSEKKIDDAWKKSMEEKKKKEASSASKEVSGSAKDQVSHKTEEEASRTPSHKASQFEEEGAKGPPLEANFGLFLSGLGMQALISLGEIEDPFTKKKQIDLNQAKYIVDTIQMLKEKTRGNLDKEEVSLLDELLYQVQMKYVAIAK